MAKKNYFLIIDTETTQDGLVADFGAVICDKRGNVITQCAVMVNGIYNNSDHPLFFDSSAPSNALWSRAGADRRYAMYDKMLAEGSRMLASVSAINRWLEKAAATYDPYLTAYNLAFDLDKLRNTAIDTNMFTKKFCLWQAAYGRWAHTKAYRNFALSVHAFNSPTDLGNMTFKTNAETMARFVLGMPDLEDEPHTALEDALDYELPILRELLKKTSVKKMLDNCKPYNWRDCQVKDWFGAK